MIPFNDLTRAADLGWALKTVADVLDTGRYIHGPEHGAFEGEFAYYLGGGYALGCASGTDALELALRAVGVTHGDKVMTVANAGFYSTAAIRRIGAKPVYVDVTPSGLCLDYAQAASKLSSYFGAVVVTHLYGRVADSIDALASLCRGFGVPLVEDCAHAAGARLSGKPAGAFGNAAAFSFYPTKNLGCLGDGGAVFTQDSAVAERVERLRQYGWDERYHVTLAGGFNSRLDEIQAAVLRERLTKLDDLNQRRRNIALLYLGALPGHAGSMPVRFGDSYVAHLAVVLAADRDRLRAALDAADIATAVHYPIPDHRQQAWPHKESLPVSEDACNRVVSLPCFPEMTDEEVERVCLALAAL